MLALVRNDALDEYKTLFEEIQKRRREFATSGTQGKALGALTDFLKNLASKVGKATSKADYDSLLKSVNTGSTTFDGIIKQMPTQQIDNITKFGKNGDEFAGGVHKAAKSGDLKQLAKLSDSVTPSSSQISNFKSNLGETAEMALKDVDDLVTLQKRTNGDIGKIVSKTDLDKAPNTTKNKIGKALDNMKKIVGGTGVVLLIGTIAFISIDGLIRAMESRKGCFWLKTENGKTTSCRVSTLSCIGTDADTEIRCTSALPTKLHNFTLSFIWVVKNGSAAEKQALATAVGVDPVTDLPNKVGEVLKNKLSELITWAESRHNSNFRVTSFCDSALVHPQVEDNKVPPCRMCNISADPRTTQFIDPDHFASNFSFQCITNPSLLDVIVDAGVSLGQDLLDGVGNTVSGALRPIVISMVVILTLVFLISLLFKIPFGKGDKPPKTSPPVNYQATTPQPPTIIYPMASPVIQPLPSIARTE